jgi:hypothetical protein
MDEDEAQTFRITTWLASELRWLENLPWWVSNELVANYRDPHLSGRPIPILVDKWTQGWWITFRRGIHESPHHA